MSMGMVGYVDGFTREEGCGISGRGLEVIEEEGWRIKRVKSEKQMERQS